jgi:thioredoxin 1
MSTNKSFQDLIGGETPVLVDFFAEWCGPCKMMKPVLEQLKGRMQADLHILKVDVDRSQAAAMQFQIQSVPTLILFRKGQILWRHSGTASAAQLEQIIHQHTASA